MSVIEFRNVSKHFKIYKNRSYSAKEKFINKILNRNKTELQKFDVLKNVSFKIEKGETVGIIGENGTGKSTTLKIISKILYADSGEVIVNGKVSSLLEVGAGFQPDLTGRENVYLYGSILGLSKKEVGRKYSDIVKFSEVEQFMDTAVKNYSSGMYMRLAFAVAINVDPDILIIDEVLAVGDEAFQKKCINKILAFKKQGKTIVFVSHDMGMVRKICDRVFFIKRGGYLIEGSPEQMIGLYMKLVYSNAEDKQELETAIESNNEIKFDKNNYDINLHKDKEYGNMDLEITNIYFSDLQGNVKNVFEVGEDIKIHSSENITGNIYYKWIKKNEPNNIELKGQKSKKFNYEPKISIVVPTFNTPKRFLIDMIESVIKQTYPNWELCISDGGSYEKYITEIIKRYQDKYKNIKFNELNENRGIAGNSNAALQLTTGDFVALLDHDDILPPNALFEIVKIINEKKDVDFIYTDEDKISENSKKRFDPHFKPDWSPDTLKSYNYICHLSVIKKSLLDKIGGFREGFNGSQDYDLILRATEKAKVIFHIPKILYHWRVSDKSVAKNPNAKMYCYESAKKALKSHLNRLNIDANVKDGLFLGSYKIEYKMSKIPKVSIIIPNKDHVEDLGRCINSIVSKSNYKNYEIIIVENNSIEDNTFRYYEKLKLNNNIKVVKWDSNGRFNYSAINNYGVKYADGEVILLLNNDVKVINSDWIERMLEHVMRKEVGAVGAKLYYPDDTIQHAGVILGMGGIAGHVHRCLRKNTYGYFGRTHIIQNLSAVTGACLMIRKEIFEEVNGLDEKFKVAFNDIDLCSKIRQLGKLVIWTPYAELYHYESKSRGAEDTIEKQKRFNGEIELFKKKWGNILKKGDPYYNPNLTLDKEDFSINLK